jgi:hypothetical protein
MIRDLYLQNGMQGGVEDWNPEEIEMNKKKEFGVIKRRTASGVSKLTSPVASS